MKKNKLSIFYILIFCCNIACNSQEIPEDFPTLAPLVSLPFVNLGRVIVEESPNFENGDLKRFIDTNFNISLIEKYKIPKGNYNVSIVVQINEKGIITQTINLSNWGNLNNKSILEDELIRVLKTSQGWRPYRYCGRPYPTLINVDYQFKVSKEPSHKRKNKLTEFKNEESTIVEVPPKFKDGNIDSFISANFNKKIFEQHGIPKGVYKTSIVVFLTEDGKAAHFTELSGWGFGEIGYDISRGYFEKELIRILKTSSGWNPFMLNGRRFPSKINIDYNVIKE